MEWIEKLDGNVIVSDHNNEIIYMNEKAVKQYVKEGDAGLIGQQLMDCHNEYSQKIISKMIETGKNNVYTIEKNGKKKIIFQSPWYVEGEFRGITELSLEIPFDMPHYIRE